MRKAIALFVLGLALSFTPSMKAQTRFLVGGETGSSFGNLYASGDAKVEIPIKRVEIDLSGSFSPLEEHIKLGSGWADDITAGGIVWITKSVGINSAVNLSQYHTQISKSGEYEFHGVTIRTVKDFIPMRIGFDYFREFNNGIFKGTETDRVQGGDANLDMRFGCSKHFCYRVQFDLQAGRVLTQSNPVCDGTYGVTGGNGPNGSCPRTALMSGGGSVSINLEFPRRRDTEEEAF